MRAISAELFKRVGGAGSNRRLASPDRRFSGPAAGATTSPRTARTPKPEAWQHSALELTTLCEPVGIATCGVTHFVAGRCVCGHSLFLWNRRGGLVALKRSGGIRSDEVRYRHSSMALVSPTTVQFGRRQARSWIIRDMTSSSMPEGSSQRRRHTRIRRAKPVGLVLAITGVVFRAVAVQFRSQRERSTSTTSIAVHGAWRCHCRRTRHG